MTHFKMCFVFIEMYFCVFMKHLNEELDELRKKLDVELEKVSSLESKASELEVFRSLCHHTVDQGFSNFLSTDSL